MRKIIYIFILFSSVVNAKQPTIEIKMLQSEQSVAQLVALQKTMHMSDNPKQLSNTPQAICFRANINKFLPSKNTVSKPIYGCIFSDQPAMNAALLRAGLFVHTTMGMADDQSLFSSNLMTAVAGHDFNGEELVNYSKQSVIPA